MNSAPLTIEIDAPAPVCVSIASPPALSVSLPEAVTVFRPLPAYEGAVTVTPSTREQVLPTHGLTVEQDIHIMPIPNNYGLITWDGSTLTVS